MQLGPLEFQTRFGQKTTPLAGSCRSGFGKVTRPAGARGCADSTKAITNVPWYQVRKNALRMFSGGQCICQYTTVWTNEHKISSGDVIPWYIACCLVLFAYSQGVVLNERQVGSIDLGAVFNVFYTLNLIPFCNTKVRFS
jgi:hypothetical protein